MQEFRADILQQNKKGQLFFFIIVATLAVMLAALLIVGLIPLEVFQLVSFIGFAYACLRYYLQTKKQVLKKSIDKLIIHDEHVVINSTSFPVSEIKSIRINISGWKSFQRSNDRSRPIENFHSGDRNYITVFSPGKCERCEFMLESQEHWNALREYVISWYRKHILIEESVNGSKSYGLEVLMYSQIQEFKKLIANPKTTS
jgi:hypothetical protein